jgi:hypothetical protein
MRYVKICQVADICKIYAFNNLVGWFTASGNFIQSRYALITPGVKAELDILKRTWK